VSKTVLLTGATGFVGRQIMRTLADRAVSIRAIVRDRERLPTDIADLQVMTTRDLFEESAAWCAEACADVDTVIHAAWYAEPGKYLTSTRNFQCLTGTLHLAQAAADSGVRRFVGIGTCFEYDLDVGTLSVNTPLKPLTPYASAKAATFLALSQHLPLRQVEFCWCRLFYLFGEGEDARRLVPYVRARLSAGEAAELTSGEQVRDFLDVRDAARLIVDHALGPRTGAVNICSGVAITVRELIERIADEYGRRDLLRFGTRPNNLIDPPRIVGVCQES
jgi:dTDP-6-deoxy-L-talose 4-dehydrogenase (NAD+)